MAKKRVYRAKVRTKERTCAITIRCTPAQKAAVELVAKSKGKTVSALLLDRFPAAATTFETILRNLYTNPNQYNKGRLRQANDLPVGAQGKRP